MTTRLALILTGVWSLLVLLACGGGIWFVTTRVPRHQQEQRATALGGATGTVAVIGYGVIILPWAAAVGRRRRQAAEEARKAAKRTSKESR